MGSNPASPTIESFAFTWHSTLARFRTPVGAMTLNVYAHSAGLFVRGLANLRASLAKAEAQADADGRSEAGLLGARLATSDHSNAAPADLHFYTLAEHVHWAAEGARLAIAHLLGEPSAPRTSEEQRFADLYRSIDATIAWLQEVAPGDLDAGLDREVVIQRAGASLRCSGEQFLVAYAIPHFHYHLATAYGILRNQDLHLTMGDFLGNWATS